MPQIHSVDFRRDKCLPDSVLLLPYRRNYMDIFELMWGRIIDSRRIQWVLESLKYQQTCELSHLLSVFQEGFSLS